MHITDTHCVKPRPIFKNATYLITRRTSQRMFLLRPRKEINACIRYCLAVAQIRAKVKIHCVTFLSNHYHIVLTDPHGLVPDFVEELNKLLALALNCHYGRSENFWAGNVQASYVRLVGDLSVMLKTIYTLCNPTAAGLVSHGGDWPGVRLFRKGIYKAKKPSFFFRRGKNCPLSDNLELILTAPPIGCDPKRADEIVQAAVTIREKELRDRRVSDGKTFLGVARIKSQDIYASPIRPAQQRGVSPRLSCRDKWRRIESLTQFASFERDHREKRVRFEKGERDVEFPAGTYRFVLRFGAACEPG